MGRFAAFFAVAVLVLACETQIVRAQDVSESSQAKVTSEKSAAPGQQAGPVQPYRLDFLFNELEDGKKINTRHYSLDLTAGSGNELKIGTRVPVMIGGAAVPNMNYQYMDVGTRIWANLIVESGGELRLDVKSDVSNLDLHPGHDRDSATPPVVRQIQISGATLLVTGKPILIGTMDDPNSNRQFELEVTATKLR